MDASLYALEGSVAPAAAVPFCLTPEMIARLVEEAVELGATEVCVQGAVPTALPGEAYLDLVRVVRQHGPALSIHAYRPTEITDGAARLGISRDEFLMALREAGATSVPGSGARILDDRLRGILSEGTDPPAAGWIASIEAAHRIGLRSTATMVYGHLETPAQAVAHLRCLASVQDRTGGFTEFIAMPYVPSDVPLAVRRTAGEGPSLDESRALHAVARLLLHGRIDHVQAAWTKLGFAGAESVLRGGADDFGGLLLDGFLWPGAGGEAGREATRGDVRRIAAALGRCARERTTGYEILE
jgi:FO synthase